LLLSIPEPAWRPGPQEIKYTAFNKVSSIVDTVSIGRALTYDIYYGLDDQRRKSVFEDSGQVIRTKYYFGDYERISENSETKYYHYISSPTGLCAIFVTAGSGTQGQLWHTYTDHLGSLVYMVNADNSNDYKEYSYDAWGRPRDAVDWSDSLSVPLFAGRGFTGHEHLEGFALINMNGRIYDPMLGRFFSPDPYVQLPGYAGSYNRYTYCWNNPLIYTDPDGEWIHLVVGAVIGGTINVIVNWKSIDGNFWKGVGYFGVGAAAGALGAGVGAGVSSAIAGGSFGAGFVGSSAAMTATSSFFTGFAIGGSAGFSSGFTSGLGNGLLGGQNFGQAMGSGLRDGLIGGATGGLIGGVAGGIDAVRDGRRFFDGATVQDNILIDQNLPFIAQQGDFNCGPACGESASGGAVTQQQIRNALGGNPNVDGLGDAYVWQEWSMRTGRPHNWVRGGMSTQDVLTNMRGGSNVAISARGSNVGHSVLANRITERTITKISGRSFNKLLLYVMDPAKGQYVRVSNGFTLNAANIFILFP